MTLIYLWFCGHSIAHSVLDHGRRVDARALNSPANILHWANVCWNDSERRHDRKSTRICWQFTLCTAVAHFRTNYATGFCNLRRVGSIVDAVNGTLWKPALRRVGCTRPLAGMTTTCRLADSALTSYRISNIITFCSETQSTTRPVTWKLWWLVVWRSG